jgi:hypothetical protein
MSAKDLSPKERARRLKRIESARKITPEQWDDMKDGVQIMAAHVDKINPPSAPGAGKRRLYQADIEEKMCYLDALDSWRIGELTEDLRWEIEEAFRKGESKAFEIILAAKKAHAEPPHTAYSLTLVAARKARIYLKRMNGVYPSQHEIKTHLKGMPNIYKADQHEKWTAIFKEISASPGKRGKAENPKTSGIKKAAKKGYRKQ